MAPTDAQQCMIASSGFVVLNGMNLSAQLLCKNTQFKFNLVHMHIGQLLLIKQVKSQQGIL